jgi:hypothetical protein
LRESQDLVVKRMLMTEVMMRDMIKMMILEWRNYTMIQFLILLSLLRTVASIRKQMVRTLREALDPVTNTTITGRWPLGQVYFRLKKKI